MTSLMITNSEICLVKIYKWLFAILTLAQLVFTITWFLFLKRMDRVIILSTVVYIGCAIVCYIAYEIEKYRKRRKDLVDSLP